MTVRSNSRLLALVVAAVLSQAAHAQHCEGQSFYISFSEFPSGTTITNQYADKGVVFGPGAFITSDSANPTTPVLSGTPRFHGPITATFVSPPDGTANADTTALTFNAGYFDEVGSTSVSYLDINGASLGSATNQGLGIVTFTAPAGTQPDVPQAGRRLPCPLGAKAAPRMRLDEVRHMNHLLRRQFLVAAAALLVAPFGAKAQKGTKPYRIGAFVAATDEKLQQNLRGLGYVEGRDIVFESVMPREE